MFFGEIVEPSSRALWDDDYNEYLNVEQDSVPLEWKDCVNVPAKIDKLFLGESFPITSILEQSVLTNKNAICTLPEAQVRVYEMEKNTYVITYKTVQDIIVGKITEKLLPWLKAAENIYLFTSACRALHQNPSSNFNAAPCFIRYLSTNKTSKELCPRLEVPNLVTGLSASILSYCVHMNHKNCSLFVAFLDEAPLDSLNSQPIVDLLKTLGVTVIRSYKLEEKPLANNMYL